MAGLVGRADVLAGLFFIGSILVYMKAVSSEHGQGTLHCRIVESLNACYVHYNSLLDIQLIYLSRPLETSFESSPVSVFSTEQRDGCNSGRHLCGV